MGPDFRLLSTRARKEAQQYYLTYKVTHFFFSQSQTPFLKILLPQDSIPVSQLVHEVAGVAQEFTQSGGVRPFGCSLLIAGYDDDGPQLYQVDPSGAYWAWKASAIGMCTFLRLGRC
jgi:20S proteasome subunit alpha 2